MDSTKTYNLAVDHTKKNTSHVVNVEDVDFHPDSYKAFIKWDGCVNFTFDDKCTNDGTQLHICELDEFIVQLQQLSNFCKGYFGSDWGDL